MREQFFVKVTSGEYPCLEISDLVMQETFGNQYKVSEIYGKRVYKSPRKIFSWNDLFQIADSQMSQNYSTNIIYDTSYKNIRKEWSLIIKKLIKVISPVL